MKYIIILLLFSFSSQAQWYALKKKKYESSTQFQKDENGKIIFYEVVQGDSLPSRDSLWNNAKIWIKSLLNEKGDKITDEQYLYGTIEAQSSYMVYVESIISKIPHGKISYKVSIDVKEKKYRYTFTDFVFQEYKQDRRDMKYYPIEGRYKPLEVERYVGHQGAWENHRFNLKLKMQIQIAYMKTQMKRVIPKQETKAKADSVINKPVIKTKDW